MSFIKNYSRNTATAIDDPTILKDISKGLENRRRDVINREIAREKMEALTSENAKSRQAQPKSAIHHAPKPAAAKITRGHGAQAPQQAAQPSSQGQPQPASQKPQPAQQAPPQANQQAQPQQVNQQQAAQQVPQQQPQAQQTNQPQQTQQPAQQPPQQAQQPKQRTCPAEKRTRPDIFTENPELKAVYAEFCKDRDAGVVDVDRLPDSAGHTVHLYQPFFCCFSDNTYEARFERKTLNQMVERPNLWNVCFIGYEDAEGIHDASADPDAFQALLIMRCEAERIKKENVHCSWRSNNGKKGAKK